MEASWVTGNTKGGHACTETGTVHVFERESVCVGSVQERVIYLRVVFCPFITVGKDYDIVP